MGLNAISGSLGAQGAYAAPPTSTGQIRTAGNDRDGDDKGAGPAASVQISPAALLNLKSARSADRDGDAS